MTVSPDLDALLHELAPVFGERLSTVPAVRDHHAGDASHFPPRAPDAVVFPETTGEVSTAVGACARHGCPVIPYGTGTGVEGQILAVHGGLCIDLARMNRVLEVNRDDLDATVEAGVTRRQLERELRDTGLFFPIDPGADASIGGMAATRASGTNAVRYGTMRENVLGVTAVMPDGQVIRSARRARKSAAGYDLTHLLVGSEGTLGVITEVSLRLHGRPEAVCAAMCVFPSVEAAAETVIRTIQWGVPVARVELLDEVQVAAVNAYSSLGCTVAPTLFFEFHGSPRSVEEQVDTVQRLAREHGGGEFARATREEDRTRLWRARHDAYFAALALRPGARALTTDVCVPISRLAECIAATRADIAASGLTVPLVGHVGDGNFHLVILFDPASRSEQAAARALNERVVRRALEADGTCTGEHGIGLGKRHWLEAEHGASAGIMRRVKDALDPRGIMNPGKLFPD